MLGTTNITGNTVKNGSDSSDSNLYLASSSYTVALSDSSGNKLSAGSQIGVTTDSDPTSGTDQKFATNATEDEMMNYFTSDKGYVIYKQGTELYLTRAPSNLYQSDNKFYLDAEKTKLTNIKTMAEAVKIATNIHMLSAYTASSDETVEVPSGKNVTVSRYSTFANDAMIRVNGGNLIVKATDTTSSITFDGQNVETTVKYADGGIIHVAGTEGTSLTLTGADNNGTKTINFVNSFVKGPSAGGAIRNNGTATLTNCNISNNKASPTDGGSIAGGVSNFGTLTMESCLVSGNSTTGNMSGGIYAGSNAIKSTIKNCQVTNNSAKLYGGGIFLSGGGSDNSGSPISIIEDCTVTGNTAGDSTATPAVNGYGAGIYIGAGANGTSTISRTTISENNAAGGGGLYISDGTNTITSCTITKNQKSSWGGGVRIDGGTNKFEGCSVINNEASSRGGGFYLTKAGSTTLTRCTISGNIAPDQGGAGIFFTKNADGTAGTLALSGAMSITGNNSKDSTDENNLWIGDGLTIDVSGLATEGSAIGILTENDPTSGNDLQFATNATEEMKACFTHDPDTSEVVYKDGGLYLRYIQSLYYSTKSGSGLFYNDEACTNATSYTKLTEAVNSITSKGNIYMMSQYASSADEETNVTAGKSIKVIRHKSFKDASMFKITGGTFKVNATDASSSITFDGKKIETTVKEGGAFYVNGGSINFNGADKSGGGKTIAVENNVISSSSSSVYGGGVYINKNTTLLGTMNITGNTVKKGSTSSDNNLYFSNGETVALSDSSGGTLSTSSKIGITTRTAPEDGTDVQFATSATEEMRACFKSDIMGRAVIYKDSGLYITLGYDALYYKDGKFYGDEACTYDTGLTKLSEAVQKAVSGSTIHMMSQYASSADETVDVPAGKNITVSRYKDFKDASMFEITGGTFKVNATDATSSITFDGKKIETSVDKGGAFYVSGRSTKFILNGADKSGGGKTIAVENNVISSYNAYGGGVCINSNGTNTLTNCSVTGNTASASGYSSSRGGGVYIYKNATLLGTMNITGNTAKVGSTSSDNNLYLMNSNTVALGDGSGNALSTSSNIGVSTYRTPASSTPVQFATSATEEMKACFTADNSDYYVDYKGSDNSLYLCYRTTYSDLYYKNNNFYSDSACSNSTGITKMSEAVASMTSSGKIHMLSQYASSADETVTVPAGRNVTVLRESSFTNASMFKITGGTFKVNAPKTNSSITFDGKSLTATANFNGGAFDVGGDSGKLELNGASDSTRNIILQNNRANKGAVWDSITNHGGAIYVESQGGGVTCNNCVMKGNASSMRGGAVCVVTGTNSFKNCTMDSNSKPYYGGAFASLGIDGMAKVVNTLENCSFTNNASIDYGGNLLLDDGTTTFTNCTVSGGSTRQKGSGVYCTGATATFEGCSIKNNTGSSYGGGINFLRTNTSNIKVSNTEISGNTASSKGGGIYVEIYNNETEGKITLTGATKITGNKVSSSANNVYIVNGQLIDVTGLATEQGAIGVKTAATPTASTPVQFATGATEEMKACFTHDPGTSEVVYKDGGLYLRCIKSLYYSTKSGSGLFYNDEACTSSTGLTKLTDAVGSIDSKGKIYMMSQYASSASETVTVPAGKNIQVIRHKNFKDASMFKITGGTFTVNATDATSSITFDGKKIETSVDKGGAFYVDGGSINFNGADKSGGGKTITIENNVISSSSASGGGVCLKGGTNTLENCSITGNTASSSSFSATGGGVCIYGGTNTLSNCSITGNTASASSSSASYAEGGGVYISGSGTNTLENCSITENKASSSASASASSYAFGGGVYLNSNGTCTLTNCSITGNTASASSSSASARGGGVCSWSGTNTLTNCSITENTAFASSTTNSAYANGGGVCIWENTTLLGTMDITGNTAKVGSTSSDSNLYFYNKKTVALSDRNNNKLSTSSKIGVTTETAPTSSNSIKFAIGATSAMASCFTPDNSSYKVTYSSSTLYLAVK